MEQQFKSSINWEGKIKLCKLYAKEDKKGNTYFLGDLNKSMKLMLQQNTGQFAKEGEWQASLVPVKWEKIEEPKPKPKAPEIDESGLDESMPF